MVPENGLEERSGSAGEATVEGGRSIVAMGLESELWRGPEDQPPDEGPNGEMEGAAGSDGAVAGRPGDADAGRELAVTEEEMGADREGAVEADGRVPDEEETPLRSSSNGMRRCAWMSLSRPSSRWNRCSWR